jgi:Asp-tRNA(Asn)/Glu-tRNA(Gln) amidotransferase A subunit family amidase
VIRTRREILRIGGALAAGSLLQQPAIAAVRLGTRRDGDLCALSATAAISLMRSGAMTAEEYVTALLSRAEQRRDLNAFIELDSQQVLEAGRAADRLQARGSAVGRLHGLPIPVKDSVLTADYPTTAGTRAVGPLAPRRDAPLIHGLRQEGAIVMGKTNLHELSTGYTSNNAIFGAVRNPYDPARIPGGSSGGTAAAVAAGIAPLGIAEDTAGSIRVPAALCGIFGFRPTVGRYSAADVAPLVKMFDTLGPHARHIDDILLFDAILTGREAIPAAAAPGGIRLGVPRGYFFEGVESETAAIVEDRLSGLAAAGVTLIEADIADVQSLLDQTFVPILFHETYATLDAWFQTAGVPGGLETILAGASPAMQEMYSTVLATSGPAAIPREAYEHAVRVARPALIDAVGRYFGGNRLDAMIVPATLCPATLIGEEVDTVIDGRTVSIFDAFGHNAMLAPACGLPALTMPAGFTRRGLPVALELIAPSGADDRLLGLGSDLARR